jgi:hypothetical protein
MARIAHFYNEELIQIIQEAERLYFQQGRSDYSSKFIHPPFFPPQSFSLSSFSSIVDLVAIGQSLEESPFVYQSLLAVPTLKQVRQVVLKLKSTLDGIISQRPRDSFLDRISDFIRPPTNYYDILSEIIDSLTINFRVTLLLFLPFVSFLLHY